MSTPATTTSRTDKNLDAAPATVQTEIGRTDGK
ncbi:integral membrane plasmid transfer protein, partial [Streptomyces sp. SID5926]|nr:integral membrane plasmid transfer protein [Streptomyces sp. SID5926]